MRSGKRLARRVSEIAVQFKQPVTGLFAGDSRYDIAPNRLVIQIQPDGILLLNGAAISMAELESRLAAAMAKDPQTSIVIKGDPQAYYEMVVNIIDMAARLNITNVGVVTSRIGS
jgi:biopolymer transport protein ExbD